MTVAGDGPVGLTLERVSVVVEPDPVEVVEDAAVDVVAAAAKVMVALALEPARSKTVTCARPEDAAAV